MDPSPRTPEPGDGVVNSPDAKENSPSTKALSSAVEHINALVQQVHRELRFSVDDTSGRVVIKVLDLDTKEVVRQIPPEQVIAVLQSIQHDGHSLGVNVTA